MGFARNWGLGFGGLGVSYHTLPRPCDLSVRSSSGACGKKSHSRPV